MISFPSGSEYRDIASLLRDLHTGAVEIGSKAVVLSCDNPETTPPSLGFMLYEGEREWTFCLPVEALRDSLGSITPGLRWAMQSIPSRVQLSCLLQAGRTLEQIESAFSDPMIRHIYARASEMEAKGQEAQSQVEAYEKERANLRRWLQPHPAGTAFMLSTQAGALRSIALELALGKHLA